MSITQKPTAGNQYKVIAGDRLNNIEKSAYGYITSSLEKANPYLLKRPISLEGRNTIWPDDILTIPELPTKQVLKTSLAERQLSNRDKNKITLIIADIEMEFDSMRIVRLMDAPSDGWSCRIQWVPGFNADLDRALTPFTYPLAKVYIGNDLIINGVLYSVQPDNSKDGLTMVLEGFSFSCDIIDSTMTTPYEAENITLLDRANQLLAPLGMSAELDDGVDQGGVFDRVTGDITDPIFNHLEDLATQRGLLISATPEGNILFTKAKNNTPVGTISSGEALAIGWGASFDGRKLFNQITAIGESPGAVNNVATVTDRNVPRSRFMTFKADNTTDGDIETSAKWQRTKQFADALTIPFPVSSWYAPNGELWKENTLVTVISKEIFVPNGFTFLIRQVEYVEENSGQTSTLHLVPPSVYNGEEIILPWGDV